MHLEKLMLKHKMSHRARGCNMIHAEQMSYNYQDFLTDAPWINTLGSDALQAL